MISRRLPYDENLSKQHKILQILRYDSEHRRSGIAQPVLPVITKTSPPYRQSVAADSVVRRPVSPGGLPISNMREYTEDELDAALRALGIKRGHLPTHEQKN